MWQQLKAGNLTELKEYANVVLKFFASDEYYEELSEVYLARQLTNKGNNLKYFLYDDGKKQMTFGLKYSGSYPNPYTKEKGMWKVCDLSYWGNWGDIDANGVSQEAVRFGVQSIKDKLNELGVICGYIIFNMDTQRVNTLSSDLAPQARIFLQFLNDIQKSPEITDTKPFEDGTHFVCHFKI